MVMISNVSAYGTGYSKVRQNGGSTGKAYDRKHNYRAYLTEKYECLRSTGYSVNINGSLLTEAAGDEKTAKWLEYNLSLIPKAVEGIKSTVEARGAKLVSCSIKINGYDSMTAEVCTVDEADPGTEKARKELEERLQKVREEKKAKQRKAAQRQLLLERSKNQLNNRHLENIDRISELTEKQEKPVDRFRQLQEAGHQK